VVNKLDRMYATTQNTCDRLALVAKSQWLQSQSTLTNFNKPVATVSILRYNIKHSEASPAPVVDIANLTTFRARLSSFSPLLK